MNADPHGDAATSAGSRGSTRSRSREMQSGGISGSEPSACDRRLLSVRRPASLSMTAFTAYLKTKLLLKTRSPITTFFELVSPALFVGILVLGYFLSDVDTIEAGLYAVTHFDVRPLFAVFFDNLLDAFAGDASSYDTMPAANAEHRQRDQHRGGARHARPVGHPRLGRLGAERAAADHPARRLRRHRRRRAGGAQPVGLREAPPGAAAQLGAILGAIL